MDTYKIIRVNAGNTYQVVNISAAANGRQKGSCLVTGNLPEVYPSMYLQLDVDRSQHPSILACSLSFTEHNQKVLSEHGVSLADYIRTYHRFCAIREVFPDAGWKIANASVREWYSLLSFAAADSLHHTMIGNAREKERIRGINDAILHAARKKRVISYSIPEFLSLFETIERTGSYPPVSTETKLLALTDTCFTIKDNLIWDDELLRKSELVVHRITRMLHHAVPLVSKEAIASYTAANTERLDADQRHSLTCLETSAPCIITGGAGVGKTTDVDSILALYGSEHDLSDVLLVAPTGKAARRLAEKTGLPASTIHKAIRKSPDDEFVGYTPSSPLPHSLVVVDESSMIDTETMYDLLGAIKEDAKLIFVGDHHQLYPVGYGEPFFDFLSLLPVYQLTINHRQNESTDILTKATDVLAGKPITNGRGVDVVSIAETEITSFVSDENVQYISPFNKVNARINQAMKKGDDDFNVGDKVIFNRNTKNYCNGDMGVIKCILAEEMIVKVGKKSVSVPKRDYDDLSLGYSITVHKMQGSENDKVVLFTPKHNSFVDSRMLYTAVTRTKEQLTVYEYEEHT